MTVRIGGQSYQPITARAPYLGQVTNGCRVMDTLATNNNQFRFRSPHIVQDNVTSIQVIMPNFAAPGNQTEQGLGRPASINVGVEFPYGVYTRVTFGGSNTGTIPNNAFLISDPTPVNLTRGSMMWLNGLYTNSAGVVFTAAPGINTALGARSQFATSGLSDPSTTGFGSGGNSGTALYGPCAIIGQTARGSVIVFGDSRPVGFTDVPASDNVDCGLMRGFKDAIATIDACSGGDSAFAFLSSNTNRLALATYASSVVLEYGANDCDTRTATQIENDLTSIRALIPATKPVWLTTKEPKSTTADGQTVNTTNNNVRMPLNTWCLAPARIGTFAGCLDTCSAVETGGTNGSGKWVPGTTNDGIHQNQAAYRLQRDLGFYNPAQFA